jgi:hypothetical protein
MRKENGLRGGPGGGGGAPGLPIIILDILTPGVEGPLVNPSPAFKVGEGVLDSSCPGIGGTGNNAPFDPSVPVLTSDLLEGPLRC